MLKLKFRNRTAVWTWRLSSVCSSRENGTEFEQWQYFKVVSKRKKTFSHWFLIYPSVFIYFLSDEAVNPPAESTFTMSSFHLRLTGGNATTATPLPLSLTWLFFLSQTARRWIFCERVTADVVFINTQTVVASSSISQEVVQMICLCRL